MDNSVTSTAKSKNDDSTNVLLSFGFTHFMEEQMTSINCLFFLIRILPHSVPGKRMSRLCQQL